MITTSLHDPFALHFDTFAGDIYTLDTASITLTAGTLTANTITDGTATLTGGVLSVISQIGTSGDPDLLQLTTDLLTVNGGGQFDNIGVGIAPELDKGIYVSTTSALASSVGIRNESVNTLGSSNPGILLGLSFIHGWEPSAISGGFGARKVGLLTGAHGGPSVDTSGATSAKDAEVTEMSALLSAFGSITGGGLHSGTLTIVEAIGFHAFDLATITSATVTTQFGIKIDNQTKGATNCGISLTGDITADSATLLGSAILFGAGQDASIGYDGTDLLINTDVVGSGSLIVGDKTGGNYTAISATGAIIQAGSAVASLQQLTTTQGRIKNTTVYTSDPAPVPTTDEEVFGETDSGGFTVTLDAGVEGAHHRIVNIGISGKNLTVAPKSGEKLLGVVDQTFILFDGEAIILTWTATKGWN